MSTIYDVKKAIVKIFHASNGVVSLTPRCFTETLFFNKFFKIAIKELERENIIEYSNCYPCDSYSKTMLLKSNC